MASLVDVIEAFLIERLNESAEGSIEVQRSELAALFSCVPSQINYCLQTRFAPERGYLVESRRGGGGYIRITRTVSRALDMWRKVLSYCSSSVPQETAQHIIELLYREGLVTTREARMLLAAVDRQTLRLMLPLRDEARANLLRAMLGTLMISEGDE